VGVFAFTNFNNSVKGNFSGIRLSQEETAGLLYMREEEKLARDVYIVLYNKWGLPIFSNISQSEQTHTDFIRTLLVKYSVSDPVINDNVGEFTNPDLKKLFDDLKSQGERSLADAFIVGATIEDLDIRDLKVEIEKTNKEDIMFVYENLMKGSRNHLRSFVTQIDSRGGSYVPQYISSEEYNSVISTSRETGPRW
jgi:hypothetical protein